MAVLPLAWPISQPPFGRLSLSSQNKITTDSRTLYCPSRVSSRAQKRTRFGCACSESHAKRYQRLGFSHPILRLNVPANMNTNPPCNSLSPPYPDPPPRHLLYGFQYKRPSFIVALGSNMTNSSASCEMTLAVRSYLLGVAS